MKTLRQHLSDAEMAYLKKALKEHGGAVPAAKAIGLPIATFYRKMNRYFFRRLTPKKTGVHNAPEPKAAPIQRDDLTARAAPAPNSSESSDATEAAFLNADQLGIALNLSPAMIRNLARKRKLPYIKLGYRTHIFDLRECREALDRFVITEAESPHEERAIA